MEKQFIKKKQEFSDKILKNKKEGTFLVKYPLIYIIIFV